jgi:hypothetical protein
MLTVTIDRAIIRFNVMPDFSNRDSPRIKS